MRPFDGERIVRLREWRNDCGRRQVLAGSVQATANVDAALVAIAVAVAAVLQALRHRLRAKRAAARERRILHVKRHRDAALGVSSLFPLQAHGERTAHGMRQPFAGVFARQKAVAHPTSGGAIATDVAEAALVIAIRCAEADLLDGLVDDQALGVVVDDAQTVAADVQQAADRSASGVLCKLKWIVG